MSLLGLKCFNEVFSASRSQILHKAYKPLTSKTPSFQPFPLPSFSVLSHNQEGPSGGGLGVSVTSSGKAALTPPPHCTPTQPVPPFPHPEWKHYIIVVQLISFPRVDWKLYDARDCGCVAPVPSTDRHMVSAHRMFAGSVNALCSPSPEGSVHQI